jgi:hypothetical protein
VAIFGPSSVPGQGASSSAPADDEANMEPGGRALHIQAGEEYSTAMVQTCCSVMEWSEMGVGLTGSMITSCWGCWPAAETEIMSSAMAEGATSVTFSMEPSRFSLEESEKAKWIVAAPLRALLKPSCCRKSRRRRGSRREGPRSLVEKCGIDHRRNRKA